MKRTVKPFSNIAGQNGGQPDRLEKLWENALKVTRPTAAANEFILYGEIYEDMQGDGIISQGMVKDFLGGLPEDSKEIGIRINSRGGSVFEGVAIYNALATWRNEKEDRFIKIHIDSLAASIASVVAMVGDEIEIAGNAMMMIHRASTLAWGHAAAMRGTAEVLEKIDETIINTYEARTGQKPEDLKAWLDGETYMTAAEAVERGFADKKTDLKGKPEPKKEPEDKAPDEQSVARLAAARLMQAKSRQAAVSAHLATHAK